MNLPGSCWSAATQTIVFSSSREPHDEIFIIPASGKPGEEKRITQRTNRVAYEPSFSPDGQWVVFESHRIDVEGNGVIMKHKSDGTGSYVALTGLDDDCRQPNWSPIGPLIVYQRFADNQWDLWVTDDVAGEHRQLTTGSGDKTDASFSPNGQWIVYSSDAGGLAFANLYITPVSGGSAVRITHHDGYDGAPSWSPDGSSIAFESYEGDPDGSPGTTIWILPVQTP